MPRPQALLLVALVALAALAPQAAASISPNVRCPNLPANSEAAFRALKNCKHPTCLVIGDVIKGIEDFKLWDVVRRVSRGKCIVAPTNHALSSRFARLGLYSGNGNQPKSAIEAFKKFVAVGMTVKCNTLRAVDGCYPVHGAHEFGLKNRRLRTIHPKAWGGALSSAGGAPDLELTELTYSVLGTGYNVYKGLPSGAGMSAVDPGLTLMSVFDLTSDQVNSLSKTGGSCKAEFSSEITSSVDDYSRKIGATLNIEINLKKITAQINGEFQMINRNTESSQARTVSSQAAVFLGGFGLSQGLGGMKVNEGFYKTVQPLMQAASTGKADLMALQAIVDGYGTHYIKTVFWGGLAASITQVTASDYYDLEEFGIKGNASIQVAGLANASASVNYDQKGFTEIKSRAVTFKQTLLPSNVPLAIAYTSDNTSGTPTPLPSFIDCVTWTKSLQEAAAITNFRAPVEYQVAPLWGLFTFSALFANDTCGPRCTGWSAGLTAASELMSDYVSTCGYIAASFDEWKRRYKEPGYTACAESPNAERCVIGTFKTSGGECAPCFTTGEMSPCNGTITRACNRYKGDQGAGIACYCKKAYEGNADCINLAPAGPRPPAPNIGDFFRRKALK